MEIKEGELFLVFLSRLETARAELRDRFDHIESNENFLSVMQTSVKGPEMFSVYKPLIDHKAPLAEIKRQLIDTDLFVRRQRREALSNNLSDFVEQNFDPQHNRFGSPQRRIHRFGNNNEYYRKSHSSNSDTCGTQDYKPKSNTPPRYRSDSPGQHKTHREKIYDGFRDRSRSRSPYQSDRNYSARNPNDKYSKPVFNRSTLRSRQASRSHSPQRYDTKEHSYTRNKHSTDKNENPFHRSPSPAGDGHYSQTTPSRHVNFIIPSTQLTTEDIQETSPDTSESNGVDPDLRDIDTNTNTAIKA